MPHLVVDTSVILKWFFLDEEFSDKAVVVKNLHVDGKIKLVIPNFAFFEVTRALKDSKRNLDKSTVEQALDTLKNLKIKQIPSDSDNKIIKKALDRSFELGLEFFDCIFLAVADKQSCSLITDDRKFLRKVVRKISNVIPLGSFDPHTYN